MLFVQFGINSTRDVWKFCPVGLAPAARPILAKFPNNTRTINFKLYSQSHDYLYKIKQIPKMDILHPKKTQENNGVVGISSLFQRHCQIKTKYHRLRRFLVFS